MNMKYFVAKRNCYGKNCYIAFSRKRFYDPDTTLDVWETDVVFESDNYKECQAVANELNRKIKQEELF